MNFLLLGSFFFKESLESLGHRVVTCGSEESCDLHVDVDHTELKQILRQVGEKDLDFVILVENLQRRVFPKGIGESPIPTVFYSIDVHLNFYWHREFARAFDLVLTTQRDYIKEFESFGIENVFWLPWAIDTREFTDHELRRVYDIVFVGTLDPYHRRKRSYLIEELSKKFSLHLFGTQPDKRLSPCETAKVYSQAKIVLNESILGEVNFRVFEAMACGPLLMTERIGNGLLKLFRNRKHLVVYDHTDVFHLAEHYLKHSDKRTAIAEAGKETVRKKHSGIVRAREFVEILLGHIHHRDTRKPKRVDQSLGKAYYFAGLRFWPQKNDLLERAHRHFKKAIQYDSGDWVSHLYLGMAYANSQQWRKAEESYLASIRQRSDYFHSHVLLANAYSCQGKVRKAGERYRIAERYAPIFPKSLRGKLEGAKDGDISDARFNYYLGKLYEKNGLTLEVGFLKNLPDPAAERASEYYVTSMNIDPNYSEPCLALARLFFRKRLYDIAIPRYEHTVRIDPQNAEAHYELGFCYAYCHRRKEAKREIFKSHYLNPRKRRKVFPELWPLSDAEKGLALLELGYSFFDINLLDDARRVYRKALEYDPNNAETYAHLGITYIKLGHATLARWNLEKALKLEPENFHVLRLLHEMQPKAAQCKGG